jgi:hypothetical protein
MITAITGPLIVQPECWQVVFSRETTNPWIRRFVPGEFKHVSAYAYVPFLHVWAFFDPHIAGTDIILAAEGDPALAMISSRIKNAAVVSVRRHSHKVGKLDSSERRSRSIGLPLLGYCVPSVRRLVGVSGGAFTPSGFFKECVAYGGIPFAEAIDGRAGIQSA